jgi:serine/threonine-protein kinase
MSDPAPERPAGAPGELTGRVGKYEIRHQLGKGAMGVVYRAYDTVLERDVALKVMVSHLADDPGVYERFAREAKAVARMTHPNVVMVFDLGSHDNGSPYIAMELLQGQDLAKAMRTPPGLPLEEKLSALLQVLAGLAHAHQAGIVHRDIKPANVFLSHDRAVKLMDFGIARLTAGSMTGTGTVMGTADYMSPEQVQGAKVDGRSDLFSVGCMLYEMLTGQKPFRADDLVAIFYRITAKDPDWSLVTEAALLPVLRKALAKDVTQRYQSAEEFAVALRAAMDKMALRPTQTVKAWPSAPTQVGRAAATLPGAVDATHVIPSPRRGVSPYLYGAAGLLVLAVAGALYLSRPAPPPATPSPSVQVAVAPVNAGAGEPSAAPVEPALPPSAPAPARASTPLPGAVPAPRASPAPSVRPTPDAAAAEAERRAAEEARQAAAQLSALLNQAESDLAAQRYDASIQGFERALGLDSQNARAQQGKSAAIAARAIAQAGAARAQAAPPPAAAPASAPAFVSGRTTTHAAETTQEAPEGFSDSPGVTVKRGSQAAALPGRILFEVEPRAVSGSTPFKVRIFLLNEGNAPIQVKDMVVGTAVNGRASRAPVPPLAREVAPGQQALLREVAGQWKIDTTAWSMEVLVRTQRGDAYQNRVTWP